MKHGDSFGLTYLLPFPIITLLFAGHKMKTLASFLVFLLVTLSLPSFAQDADQLTDTEQNLVKELYDYAIQKGMIVAEMKSAKLMFPTKGYQTVIADGSSEHFTMTGDGSSRDKLGGKTALLQVRDGRLLINGTDCGAGQVIGGKPSAAALKFDRILDTPYPHHSGTIGGDMAISDLDGDGKPDILISGLMHTSFSTYIYFQKSDSSGFEQPKKAVSKKDSGSFSDHGIPGLDRGARLEVADMDGDGDMDVVIYGRTGVAMQTSLFKVFQNDGKGNFEEMCDLGSKLPLEDFEDVPGAWGRAGKADNQADEEVLGLYNALGWSKGVLELADFNGDDKIDIAFAGTKGMESGTDPAGQQIQRDWETSGVFLNRGEGTFEYLTGKGFPEAGVPANPEKDPQRSYPGIAKVSRGASAAADFNGDGKTDLVVFGQANIGPKANAGIPETQRNGLPMVETYLGNGDGTFKIVRETGLPAVIDGSVEEVDVNDDGKVDLIVLGSTGHPGDPAGGRLLQVFHGKGDGTFSKDTQQTYMRIPNNPSCMVPVFNGDVGAGDLDGDGDIDLVVAGNDNDRSLYVYVNEEGRYSYIDLDKMKHGVGATGSSGNSESDAITDCNVIVSDIDGDGHNDIVINGRGGSAQVLVFQNEVE
jgi:hypothetical protein